MDFPRSRFVPAFFGGAGFLFAILVLVLFLSGGPDPAPQPAGAAAATTASTSTTPENGASGPARAAVEVGASDYGPILFDGRGRALYAFTSDPSGESVCSGACAAAWPPYLASRELRGGEGVKQRLLGTAKRPDGTLQVAYGGRPLYYYVGDREPGQVLCQNVVEFGGTWLVLRGSARLVQ